MTDLLQVLVDFPTAKFSHLLPSLDKALVTTSDLLTLDTVDVAKRAQLPPAEVAKLADAILKALHGELGVDGVEHKKHTEGDKEDQKGGHGLGVHELESREWRTISTLDRRIDEALGGGLPTGYVTEITGERYGSQHLYICSYSQVPTAALAKHSSF
jgi:DNA repair protein RAD57